MTRSKEQTPLPYGLVPEEKLTPHKGLTYVTFWLDNHEIKKIQALADLEGESFHPFLRYHLIKTGLDVLMSNTQEIGEKFVERLEGKKEAS